MPHGTPQKRTLYGVVDGMLDNTLPSCIQTCSFLTLIIFLSAQRATWQNITFMGATVGHRSRALGLDKLFLPIMFLIIRDGRR
jgi:hypothetical protein